ncbi:phage tail sheath protein [Paenibacillus sp. BIHB 4019]|uniref:Phage tail sheath protein n=1 Tax=Paenibacillus sp. BIHB 4019 TaxID=1870819 RepID=A0A1B2DJ60_9BACL|nr:phage tail sheath subtilisin-like domain-containing protein [Paenibacillus sp. BIHB 4019]ANY67736.1 phage tail sheath protein [Paenibacillus sp. BIHB 4019]
MAGGTWIPTSLPTRPGVYINFVQAAVAAITGGERGVVALSLSTYAGTAVEERYYEVETVADAEALFGVDNIGPITLAFQGGAASVLVYTLPDEAVTADYTAMRAGFDTQFFNVFVAHEYDVTEQAALKTWTIANRADGKQYALVIGGDATTDADPALGNARSLLNEDDYIVNVINGAVIGDTSYSSSEYAPFIAGLIAGTAINASITYATTTANDVTKRLSNAQTNAALAAGSLVLTNDGKRVKIEQGITTSGAKIRSIRARQAVIDDIQTTANESYIGKLPNDDDGRAALIASVTKYLETLADNGVLSDPVVALDPNNPSTGDKVFLAISYVEIDSMERIFMTINV